MKIKLIDWPEHYPLAAYEETIAHMVAELKKKDGLLAVYQLGSMGQPGISDIDLLAVFYDFSANRSDPRELLDKKERYFISHGLYGLSAAQIEEAKKYGFYFSFKSLWGNDLFSTTKSSLSVNDLQILKTQVALEFLVKMYINMTIEKTYRIVKIRALLLQIKALLLDLDLLEIGDCPLRALLRTVISWREQWFETPPTKAEIRSWLESFYREFPVFLNGLLEKHPFYLHGGSEFKIHRNIGIRISTELSAIHRGITFPPLSFLGRKYVNLLHRGNDFQINLPGRSEFTSEVISGYHKYIISSKKWLACHLPHFMALSSSLMTENHY
jgi:hypothetical protein